MGDDAKKEDVVEKTDEGIQRADGEQPDDKKLPFSEHKRWKEVYGQLTDYKKYGKPGDIEAKLNRLSELEQAFEEAARQAAEETERAGKTKQELADEDVMKQARAQIEKLLKPELEALREMNEARRAREAALEREAVGETKAILEEVGETTEKADILAMSDILADIIKHDPSLHAAYFSGHAKQAVRGAFDKFAKRFGAKTELSEKAKSQKAREAAGKLPKAHGGGGTSDADGGKTDGPPKSLKEATDRAMQRLKGMEL